MVTTRRNTADAALAAKMASTQSNAQPDKGVTSAPYPDINGVPVFDKGPAGQASAKAADPVDSISEHDRNPTSVSKAYQSLPGITKPLEPSTSKSPLRRQTSLTTLSATPEDATMASHNGQNFDLKSKKGVKVNAVADEETTSLMPALSLKRGHVDDGIEAALQAVREDDRSFTASSRQKGQPSRQKAADTGASLGTAEDPIILGNSPAKYKKVKRVKKLQPPHKFLDEGYRELYNYQSPRPALDVQPASGTTFTGDKSQDMYRMIQAKSKAEGVVSDNTFKHAGRPLSFPNRTPEQLDHPTDRYVLTKQKVPQSNKPDVQTLPTSALSGNPYAGYQPYPPPSFYNTLPLLHEEDLRYKATQYSREYNLFPKPRSTNIAAIDPDETSCNESDSPTSSDEDEDAGDTTNIKDMSILMVSLMRAYPNSRHKKGLTKDIISLFRAQSKAFGSWHKAEKRARAVRNAHRAQKAARSQALLGTVHAAPQVVQDQDTSAAIQAAHVAAREQRRFEVKLKVRLEVERRAALIEDRIKRDEEIALTLSAYGGMWQGDLREAFETHNEPWF